MKIKKYTARTEAEAITSVKDELGLDAIILSIKKIQPKGWFAFLRKPQVEVTAAYDMKQPDARAEAKTAAEVDNTAAETAKYSSRVIFEQQKKIKSLEEELTEKDGMLANFMSSLTASSIAPAAERMYENIIVQSF